MKGLPKITGYKVYYKSPGNKTWKIAFKSKSRKKCTEYINSPHSRGHFYLLVRTRQGVTGYEPLVEVAR